MSGLPSLDYLNPHALGAAFVFMIIPAAILLGYVRFLDATGRLRSKSAVYAFLTGILVFGPFISLVTNEGLLATSAFPTQERPLSEDVNFLAGLRAAAALSMMATLAVIAHRFAARLVDVIVAYLVLSLMQFFLRFFLYEFLPAVRDNQNIFVEVTKKHALVSLGASILMIAVFFAIDGAVYGLKKARPIQFSRGVANVVVLLTLLGRCYCGIRDS
jgi:hypothetical protein